MTHPAPASSVLAFPAPTPAQSCDYMAAKLSFHADAWDVAEDLRNSVDAIVVIDTRSPAHYEQGHVPGAVSFPHRTMDADSTAHLDRSKVYVTYCDGIGCNGSTASIRAIGAWTASIRWRGCIGSTAFICL